MCASHMVTEFKTRCFGLVLWDTILVQFAVRKTASVTVRDHILHHKEFEYLEICGSKKSITAD